MNRSLSLLVLAMTLVVSAKAGEVFRSLNAALGKDQTLAFAQASKLQKSAEALRLEGSECVVDNGVATNLQNGLCWYVKLNQTAATPFSVSAESSLEEGLVSLAENPGYSLYIDVHYIDDTRLYGQHHSFRAKPGAGWQKGMVTVFPDKPVKAFMCYLLYRYRSGRARFREPTMKTYAAAAPTIFDAIAVQVADESFRQGFLLHDAAAADDGWTSISDGESVKGCKLSAKRTKRDGAYFFDAKLESTTDNDRALTLVYTIPLPKGELVWLEDPRCEIPMGKGQYRNTRDPGCGYGGLSRWPFGAVRAGGRVWALGYDPEAPAIFRVVANGELRRLMIAFDLGLAKEKRDARVRFVCFESEGKDGFRGALAKYATLYPEAYRVRIRKHGIWMAFQSISSVKGWQDFGFGIKEGDREPDWDDANGVLTTHYTEPTSWWMNIASTNNLTIEDAINIAKAEAAKPKGNPYAKAWIKSSYRDADGELTGKLMDRPWCKGACWNLNALAGIPGGDYEVKQSEAEYKRRYEGKTFPKGVDGEYIDSAECHLPPRVDFRRENFRYAKTPLSWDKSTFKPVVTTALSIYEYVRSTAERVHAMGRIMQANGAPYSWPWLIPFIDYGGQETQWIERKEGAWNPMSDSDLLYRTAMSYGKPYCFLMNVKFECFTDEMVEKYFQRCLAYGLMSSFFSPNASQGHYFSRPELYERHRRFFKKYGPLQRQVSEAGWRAVNKLLASDTNGVFVEQFGDNLVTVFNSTSEAKRANLRTLNGGANARELVEGKIWTFESGKIEVEIPPETVRLLSF